MQNLPAKVTEAQQTKVLASLDAQVKKLEENVASISKMDKAEHNKDASDQLASVLGKMGAMAGQDTPAKQTFLH